MLGVLVTTWMMSGALMVSVAVAASRCVAYEVAVEPLFEPLALELTMAVPLSVRALEESPTTTVELSATPEVF